MLLERKPPPPMVVNYNATPAQLALPWTRDPGRRGISPHGLNTSRNPARFFFSYCGPYNLKPPYGGQTEPMAVGSAVDGLLKQALAQNEWKKNRRIYYRGEVNNRTFGLFGTVEPQMRTKAVRERAQITFEAIRQSPIYEHLCGFDLIDLETDRKEALWVHGAPLNGKLDFLFGSQHEPRNIISDLKINGAFTKAGSTPVPGYNLRYDFDIATRTGKVGKPHKDAGQPLEDSNDAFAMQLGTYAIMEARREQDTPFPDLNAPTRSILVQCTFKPPSKKNPEGKIIVTAIDSYISGTYQRSVLKRYQDLWASIQARTLVPDEMVQEGLDMLWLHARRSS